MELGQTVVLYNLDNLYESLYDALNQVPAYCTVYTPCLSEISSEWARIS